MFPSEISSDHFIYLSANFARMKERQFAAHINQKNSAELRQEMNRVLRELDAMKKRSAELSKLFKRLYEAICCERGIRNRP